MNRKEAHHLCCGFKSLTYNEQMAEGLRESVHGTNDTVSHCFRRLLCSSRGIDDPVSNSIRWMIYSPTFFLSVIFILLIALRYSSSVVSWETILQSEVGFFKLKPGWMVKSDLWQWYEHKSKHYVSAADQVSTGELVGARQRRMKGFPFTWRFHRNDECRVRCLLRIFNSKIIQLICVIGCALKNMSWKEREKKRNKEK